MFSAADLRHLLNTTNRLSVPAIAIQAGHYAKAADYPADRKEKYMERSRVLFNILLLREARNAPSE